MEIAILIGGEGSRIKKISKTVPKPFLKIGNKSIIDHQLKFLSKVKKKYFYFQIENIQDFIIN